MDETAWLIEINTPEGDKWFSPDSNFTNDPNNVIRFSRKCDAEAIIAILGFDDFFKDSEPQSAFATEHMWCELPPNSKECQHERNIRANACDPTFCIHCRVPM